MPVEQTRDPLRAAHLLRSGRLVAFPTETVYGLGVDATNGEAVARLFKLKRRPGNNPLIVHLADLEQLHLAARDIPPLAIQLLSALAPGPLTVVVPKSDSIVPSVTAGLSTVGVRIPDHDLARQMLRATGLPIAAPSANRSGRPSATTFKSVLEDFGDELDAILIGDPSRIGLESTVVDCLSNPARVLRPGGVTLEQLRSVNVNVVMAGVSHQPGDNSPGRLHPHYQPRAKVILVETPADIDGSTDAAYLGLNGPPHGQTFGWEMIYPSVQQYAQAFYEALREVDRRGLTTVYCQQVPAGDSNAALADRLRRAAGD
ncbi:MAG: threonylcarbamoyl-AMP synthase [Pirellulaceae bacterium]|nr:threonylcarbamoyl-AMP synthase [Pirellulaceae bacterium]